MPKQILFQIKERLGDIAFQIEEPSAKRAYLSIHKSDLRHTAGLLLKDFGARFCIASGMDNHKNMEVLYHFSLDEFKKIITIRTFVEKPQGQIDSLVPVAGAACMWIEREMHELLGIEFNGHPNLKPLLLSEDWPRGKYPLKKDFKNER